MSLSVADRLRSVIAQGQPLDLDDLWNAGAVPRDQQTWALVIEQLHRLGYRARRPIPRLEDCLVWRIWPDTDV